MVAIDNSYDASDFFVLWYEVLIGLKEIFN
jgi:hypothetical protein